MTRSRIRNLDAGYRLCEKCGKMYHWSIGFCLCEIQKEVDAIKADAAAKRDELRPGWIDSARDVTPIKTMADKIVKACDDWTCNFCGIAQPAWAGDCLTCETVPMMGDRD